MAGLISEEDINQVRERNDLVQVVSEHVTLKKKGRLLWGLCPFHNEKTPSFKVDPGMQLWHCFGCGEGGNVFTFLMKIEHVEFPEAVETLAERVGYEIKREEDTGPSRSFRQRLLDANEAAAKYWALYLRRNPTAAAAREYLKGRGFHIELAAKFMIGYASAGRDDLVKHLTSQKFTGEEIVAAGLAVRTDRGLKDRFFDRVIFPIKDVKGRVVAFGGRALGSGTPKYLNSPETPVYHKSATLYALDLAKNEIVTKGAAIVVEGYTDVIALHAAGFRNAVATCGTALTPEHVKLLGRFANRVILVFDADVAGMAAAERGVSVVGDFGMVRDERLAELSGRQQVDVLVAVLPEGYDPADLIATRGSAEFAQVLEKAVDLLEFAIDRKIGAHDLSTSKGRIGAAREALALIAPLTGAVAREEYVRLLADKIAVSVESLSLELKEIRPATTEASTPQTKASALAFDAQAKAEQEMLRLCLSDADIRKKAREEIGAELFTVDSHRELFGVLAQFGGGSEGESRSDVVNGLEPRLQSLASGLLLDTESAGDQNSYFVEILTRLKEFEVGRQIDRLKSRIERLNRLGNEPLYDSLFNELIALEARRRELKGEARGGTTSAV